MILEQSRTGPSREAQNDVSDFFRHYLETKSKKCALTLSGGRIRHEMCWWNPY